MKIAVCFFGEMSFMDRFMIQNLTRCLIIPFQKYNHKDETEFYYFLHTYFSPNVLSSLEMMKSSFPFTSMTIHDREMVLQEKPTIMDKSLFLQDYSLRRVKKKWKLVEDLDLVIFTRLDLLFTKSLSESDIDLIIHRHWHLFLGDQDKPFVAVGDPMVMKIFTDHLSQTDNDNSFIDILRTQYSIKIQYVSVVFVRILPQATVSSEDSHVCPYLEDIIKSSATTIRLSKRKNSITK